MWTLSFVLIETHFSCWFWPTFVTNVRYNREFWPQRQFPDGLGRFWKLLMSLMLANMHKKTRYTYSSLDWILDWIWWWENPSQWNGLKIQIQIIILLDFWIFQIHQSNHSNLWSVQACTRQAPARPGCNRWRQWASLAGPCGKHAHALKILLVKYNAVKMRLENLSRVHRRWFQSMGKSYKDVQATRMDNDMGVNLDNNIKL